MSKLTDSLVDAIQSASEGKTKGYDTTATVVRIEGATAWVHIPGGVDETPVKLTINAKEGDTVQVRVSGGSAWLVGNATAPPTDDTTAETAYYIATDANELAESASKAASEAWGYAESAHSAASSAKTSADEAKAQADSATGSANTALTQLGIVENVVGVLDLLAKHGNYQLTTDTTVQDGKWYFTKTTSNEYQVVNDPAADPSAAGYYELTNIDEAVQNYVSSHLVLADNGLWLQTDGSAAKLQLSTSDGVVIYNESGTPVAQYGEDTVIGDKYDFHIKIDGNENEIGFYRGATRVAYMNGSQLYVENSLSFGHFMFYERNNGHFTLKYIGGGE